MARIAYAARTLLKQVGGDASSVVGDTDALGVHRTVMVSTGLPLDALEDDDRVSGVTVVHTDLGDVALVEFVSGRRADLTHPFDLD